MTDFSFFDISDIGDEYVEKAANKIAAKGFEVENCFRERKQERGPIGRNSIWTETKEFFTIEFSNDNGEFGAVLIVKSTFHFEKRNPYDGKAIAACKNWGGYICQATDETKKLLNWKS